MRRSFRPFRPVILFSHGDEAMLKVDVGVFRMCDFLIAHSRAQEELEEFPLFVVARFEECVQFFLRVCLDDLVYVSLMEFHFFAHATGVQEDPHVSESVVYRAI